MHSNSLFAKYNLKIAPIIYQGDFKKFIDEFDLENFNSLISQKFYGLPFINTPKATEGVVIRTINPNPEYNENIVLKYKKSWACECGIKKNKKRNLAK